MRWHEYKALDVLTCFTLIPNTLNLSDIYELDGQIDSQYILKGMIIYWNSHYYAYFRVFINGEEEWLRVDDKVISKKGSWHEIVSESVDSLETPTIMLFERYRESELVPELKEMEHHFKLGKSKLKELVRKTRKSKKEANYSDSKIKYVQQDSEPSTKDISAFNEESKEPSVEKRPGKPSKDDDDNHHPATSQDEPELEQEPAAPESKPVGADEWICDH